MSHIVIHDDNDNITRYRRFDDVSDAVAYLEELHNGEAATDAKLFAMEEVEFAVTSYVRVELPAAAAGTTLVAAAPVGSGSAETRPAETLSSETLTAETLSSDGAMSVDDIDTVEYVEAAMTPGDAFSPAPATPAPDAAIESTSNGEVRRGLFGR